MANFFKIIIATLLVSLVSLIGLLVISFKKSFLKKISFFLVSLAAGSLMAGAFFHLLPEAAEQLSAEVLFPTVLVSFVVFLLIEKVLHWRHCHQENCKIHTFAYMNLVGDAVHNFTDGLVIAAAFLTNPSLGATATTAIFSHEIPQEIGDFGVLIHSGWSVKKALAANFLTATISVFGGVIGYFWLSLHQTVTPYLLAFAAGGFIYIAASDLIPEIRKSEGSQKSPGSFIFFLLGIFIIYLIG